MNRRQQWSFLILAWFCCAGAAFGQREPAGEGLPIQPAGSFLLDAATNLPEVGALPTAFRRSPDHGGPDGKGRYLLIIFSGFGVQFSADTNRAQQSIGVIDLNAKPEPTVIQNVYFPTPQSANVGLAFSESPKPDGSFDLYVSGGFEDKIWIFQFMPGAEQPLRPGSPGPDTKVTARFIRLTRPSEALTRGHDNGKASIYPTGIALTGDGKELVSANNLGDNVSVISVAGEAHAVRQVDLHHPDQPNHDIYPYDVVTVGTGVNRRAYVSCWNDASVAVVTLDGKPHVPRYINVERHPTALLLNRAATRLFVVNSDADSVSVIDTATNQVVERIDVRLTDTALNGASPEGLALSGDEAKLYVADAHSNALAVVDLSGAARDTSPRGNDQSSRVRGFIPTGQYPAAVVEVAGRLYVGNGKGTGFEPSSMRVNLSGRTPNPPNEKFPNGRRPGSQGGQYSVSIVSGNISVIPLPSDPELAGYTQQTLQNAGLAGKTVTRLFPDHNPIRHVIYVIKENRTYDQVFGDVASAGNGKPADSDPKLAIFGAGSAAARPDGTSQDVAPNHRALALRFGLFDRFFVNSEASPDGHNWATAAFSTDYVDKAFRWEYSGRGRTYDYEGFNRLEDNEPPSNLKVDTSRQDALAALTGMLEKHLPYRNGSIDVAEPKTLYLWDAAERAGLSHRNYGEFISVISEADVEAAKRHRQKPYPDISPAVQSVPSKKLLETAHSASFRSFDLTAPDSMTVDCYAAAKQSQGARDAAITRDNASAACRGNSRFGEWLAEFQSFVADRDNGRGDRMPALSIMRFPNDHTIGLKPGYPTPQFYVADNDYAVGRLVDAVSHSSYWKDTALFFVEDDAQAGPDHVDSHRSVALVVSAYNRPGQLVHEFHSTVSMIRTIELLLGIAPMNQLDSAAAPMNIFQETPDLAPFTARLPDIAANNLMTGKAKGKADAAWIRRSDRQNFQHADLADPSTLNAIIWYACRGTAEGLPPESRMAAFDALRLGIQEREAETGANSKDLD